MNLKRQIAIPLIALALVLTVVPMANAQDTNEIQVTIQPQSTSSQVELLQPVAGQVTGTMTFDVTFNSGSVSPINQIKVTMINPPSTSGSAAGTETVVLQQTGFFVPVVDNNQDGTPDKQTFNVPYTIFLSDSVTAFEKLTVKLDPNVQSPPGASTVQPTTSAGFVNVQADYYSYTSFQMGQNIIKGSPSETITVPVDVVNQGNGPTVYSNDMTWSRDEWKVSWSPTTAMVVEPPQEKQSSNRGTVTISILSDQRTQYSNDLGQFKLVTTPRPKNAPSGYGFSADENNAVLPFVAHIQGVLIPGFGGAFGIAAMVGVGVLSRRVLNKD